jgi:hypothetical protein
VGRPDANALIISELITARNHLDINKLEIIRPAGETLGTFQFNAANQIEDANSNPVNPSPSCFYLYNNQTPDNFEDDIPISCMNVNVSYVQVISWYHHDIMIPGMNVLASNSVFTIGTENVYNCSMVDFDLSNVGNSALEGACPITIIDQAFIRGNSYTLKGKSDEDPDRPGNFGWINLDPAQDGNKNENIANWLTGPVSPAVSLPSWIGGFTGQRNAAEIKDALNTLSGRLVVIFTHDSHQGTGANLEYHETGMLLFKLESFSEQHDGGNPYLQVEGTFVKRL